MDHRRFPNRCNASPGQPFLRIMGSPVTNKAGEEQDEPKVDACADERLGAGPV